MSSTPSQPGLAEQIVNRYFSVDDGVLHIDGVGVDKVAEEFGTPLFVYDRAIWNQSLTALRDCFSNRFDIHYSIKANPHQAILRYLIEQGCGLEVASSGEIFQAIHSGCDAGKVLFAGPGKTETELTEAIKSGIGEIHIESVRELKCIESIAANLNCRPKVALRVNPDGDAQGGAMRMGGKPTPFGMDEMLLSEVVPIIQQSRLIDFSGIHLYAGTQILDPHTLATQYDRAVKIASRVAAMTGTPIRTIDFGGGLGIPYFPHERWLDLQTLKPLVERIRNTIESDSMLRDAKCIIEPGRFLVGESAVYVSRVIDVKASRDKRFVIVDGGMHQHLAASGNLGQTIKRNYPIAVATKMDQPPKESVTFCGPLCTPLDVLARDVEVPTPEIGDLFVVFQSGAYARTSSPMEFLGHPSPAEVLVSNGGVELIRERGSHADLIRDQVIPMSIGG